MRSIPSVHGPRTAALASAVGLLLLATAILWTSAQFGIAGNAIDVRVPPTAGACFMALGAGFLLVLQEGSRRQVRTVGIVTAGFALLAVCESVFRLPWHLSYMFSGASLETPSSPAWRMSPVAAFEFVLAGATICLIASDVRARWRFVVLHAANAVLLGIAFLGLLDPSLRGIRLLQPAGFPALSPSVAAGFLLFGLALIATLEIERPSALLLFEPNGTGRAFRRYLPLALVLLAILNAAALVAAERGSIAPAMAVCVLLAGNGLCLGAVVSVSVPRILVPVRRIVAKLENCATPYTPPRSQGSVVSLLELRRGCDATAGSVIVEKNRHRTSDRRAPADGP